MVFLNIWTFYTEGVHQVLGLKFVLLLVTIKESWQIIQKTLYTFRKLLESSIIWLMFK
jgi:hypothetical protein